MQQIQANAVSVNNFRKSFKLLNYCDAEYLKKIPKEINLHFM